MRKNSHGRILKSEPKEHHLNSVPKSCYTYIYIYRERERERERYQS